MPDLVYLWLSIFIKVFCGIEWVSSRQGCEWVGRVILSQSLSVAMCFYYTYQHATGGIHPRYK